MPSIRRRKFPPRKYIPQWKGFIEGFTVNFLKQNFWRVKSHMDYEDCMQEAWLKFHQVKTKYRNLDKPQHFMALYKLALTHRFNQLAERAAKFRHEAGEHSLVDFDYVGEVNSLLGDADNDGNLAIMVEQAPNDIKLVLQLMLTAPVEVLDMFAASWKKRGRTKEFGNTHLCEILGLPKKTNIIDLVSDYFVGSKV